jgi:hypothetical protein
MTQIAAPHYASMLDEHSRRHNWPFVVDGLALLGVIAVALGASISFGAGDAVPGLLRTLSGLALAPVVIGLYLTPAIVAGARRHHQLGPILAVNLFLGWTFIGWILAMEMAASATQSAARAHPAALTPPLLPAGPQGRRR